MGKVEKMTTIRYEEIDSLETKNLIKMHESFRVLGLNGRMGSAVTKIELLIESQNLSCRIYTYGRVVSAAGTFVGGFTGLVGAASTVGMVAHNIATYNPDYEIAKHLVDNKLTVSYKKEA